ncbi:hypothetical protein F2Q65_00735 [Thiohalocapsa marina]|uniref:Uncharacterized protein n=1 Tax=Thiohalocapsa marina TaxID=424902 RepID=A0A5M8FVF4_9GAMM|nr:exosortase H-associated membrane protein [Thiohalocapsa marina]KAA6187802.1 hypothetical protein F2Q65_00735 [Thiohalocapsa marina]
MLPPSAELRRFGLGLLLAMPVAMALWWFLLAPYLMLAMEPLVEWTLRLLWPQWGLGLEAKETLWQVNTTLPILEQPLRSAVFGLPWKRFSVAFALFWGLALATPGARPVLRRVRQLLLGSLAGIAPLVILMAVLYFHFELAVLINHRPYLTVQPPPYHVLALPYADWQFHLIGVGRQLALLILPTLGPVAVWAALNQPFLRAVVLSGPSAQIATSLPARASNSLPTTASTASDRADGT